MLSNDPADKVFFLNQIEILAMQLYLMFWFQVLETVLEDWKWYISVFGNGFDVSCGDGLVYRLFDFPHSIQFGIVDSESEKRFKIRH